MSNLKYKTKTATTEDIYIHLKDCKDNFTLPLDKRVNIQEYSRKIFEKGVTFEAWVDEILVGLIAAYFNNRENCSGYITSVSVTRDYRGAGIASKLLNMCIGYALKNGFKTIELEVSKDNSKAISLYKNLDFTYNGIRDDFLLMKLTIK